MEITREPALQELVKRHWTPASLTLCRCGSRAPCSTVTAPTQTARSCGPIALDAFGARAAGW